MANKQYKDFTAGAFANDQIIAQQSTSDDSYTKVPVPTFGLGDALGAEDRIFENPANYVQLQSTGTGAGSATALFYTGPNIVGSDVIDNDNSDQCYHNVTKTGSAEVCIAGDFSQASGKQMHKDYLQLTYFETALDILLALNGSGILQRVQNDNASPTLIGKLQQFYNEVQLFTSNGDESTKAGLKLTQSAIDLKITDSVNTNYFHADTENMSLVGTAGVPFDFYNSENRLYMSLHLINFGGVGNYASNALALAAGLQTGDIYRTGGVLMVVI